MRKRWSAAAGVLALLLAGCGEADRDAAEAPPPAGESDAAPGGAGERAQDALGEAAESARRTMESLGEAGKAGLEAVQENAPEIRENLDQAGERLRNAADALLKDPDPAPVDAQGDSSADPDEVPENRETMQ